MLESFRHWYLTNAVQITWFIIGAMIMSGLIYFGQGQLLNAMLCWFVAAANYWFRNK